MKQSCNVKMDIQSDKPKKISVSIGGISYQLVSDETEGYMKDIAAKADDAIKQMLQNNPSLSNIQATVLAMVNLIDIMTKETSEIDKMRARLEELSFSEAKARHELYLQREHGFELKKEILRVNELNRMLELEVAALRDGMGKEPVITKEESFEGDITIAPEEKSLERDIAMATQDISFDKISENTINGSFEAIDPGDNITNNEHLDDISKEITNEMAIESIVNKLDSNTSDTEIEEYDTINSENTIENKVTVFNYNVKNVTRPASEISKKMESEDSMASENSEASEESAYIDSDDMSNEEQEDESEYLDDLSDDPDSFHHYRQQSLDDVFH